MVFLNFDLELSGYTAAPEGRIEFRVRAAQTPRAQVQSLENADKVSIAPGEVESVVQTLAHRWEVSEAEFADACQSLERWLLPQTSRARSLLESSLAGLAADECLCLRICCNDNNLARLPWEFATFNVAGLPLDGHFYKDRTLAMHPNVCLVRFDEVGTPVERPEVTTQRLLFVSAIPPQLEPLSLHVERESIEKEFADAKLSADRAWIEHVTTDSLQRALENARLDVFQYSGHGGSSSGGYLYLEADPTSDGKFGAADLGLVLAGTGVRVAVLAACVTAEIETELPWSSVGRALVAGGVPAVVGMQLNIGDDSAIAFLSAFYRQLATCMPVGTAMTTARKSIALRRDRDFGVPVLYLRNPGNWDGVVFAAPKQKPEIEIKVRQADAYKRLHDSLHKAKMNAFHLIMRFANDFPPKAKFNWQPLRSYVNTIKICVSEMRSIAGEGSCDRDLIDPIIDNLQRATQKLEGAVANWDRDLFDDALPRLDTAFTHNMSMLDVSLNNSAKALPRHRADQFQVLIDEMQLRVVTHHACQLIEDLLDDMRDRRNMDTVNVRVLKDRRLELKSLLDSCLAALDQATAASLVQRSIVLDQSLTAADVEQLSMAYEDLCAEFGMSFYKIDSDLKDVCARLCADPGLSLQ